MPTTLLSTSIQDNADANNDDLSAKRKCALTIEVSSSLPPSLKVPDGCFLVLVHRTPTPQAMYRATLIDGSTDEFTSARGNLWILPPLAQLTQIAAPLEDSIQYFIPSSSLAAFAEVSGTAERSSLCSPAANVDPFMQLLSKVVIPLLSSSKRRMRGEAVVRYFLSSILSHLLSAYGTSALETTRSFIGGLAPRHKALIESLVSSPANLLLSSEDLAAQCGLSSTHFARAFRQTFGTTVHQYFLNLRLEQAKQLLAQGQLPLDEVARRTGYADQATFTESFKRFAGTPPGKFRRRYALCTAS